MSSLEVTEPILNFSFEAPKRATKGFNKLEEMKREAAERWANAVNVEGSFGRWHYRVAKQVSDIPGLISSVAGA